VKRAFDILLAVLLLVVLLIPGILVAALVKLSSPGAVFYWSERIGKNNRPFRMPKFRTMREGTPEVATHLLSDVSAHMTPAGSLLRRSSLDELPQLWSILAGDMSFVGPRPALFNQHDLISQRTANGIQVLAPGLTGWAQVNGRDDLAVEQKVVFDLEYLRRRSLRFDLYILWLTFVQVIRCRGVAF
jgi:O-antigen biosynthesis protein WbqP